MRDDVVQWSSVAVTYIIRLYTIGYRTNWPPMLLAANRQHRPTTNRRAAVYCLSNAIHCMGQNIKSLAACFCVCAQVLGAEYLENDIL